MKAMTVLGALDVEELGVVMMHEHLLHDDVEDPCWFDPLPGERGAALADSEVSMELLGVLQRSPFVVRENTRLTRSDPIAGELARFASAGGGTVVELTCRGLVPDPDGLVELSQSSGIHIVAGCGYYVDHVLPSAFDGLSVDEITEALVSDLRYGIAGTAVRAGIIGEIGTSPQMTEREQKSVRAAGQAAVETGASVMVHLGMTGEQAFPCFAILAAEGVKPERVVMNHIDEASDLDYALRVAELGCVVEFDTFGSEWYYDSWKTWEPRDTERVAAVAALCNAGHAHQITVSQDVFYKQSLRAYGGFGYDHLLVSIVPMMREAGVSEDQLRLMLVETPRRLLGIAGLSGDGCT